VQKIGNGEIRDGRMGSIQGSSSQDERNINYRGRPLGGWPVVGGACAWCWCRWKEESAFVRHVDGTTVQVVIAPRLFRQIRLVTDGAGVL
jgi:hypothetical protein